MRVGRFSGRERRIRERWRELSRRRTTSAIDVVHHVTFPVFFFSTPVSPCLTKRSSLALILLIGLEDSDEMETLGALTMNYAN